MQRNQRNSITFVCLATAVLARIFWAGAGACTASAAEPVLIDLRPVLNTAWEDDGIPGNMAGGWSDEGVNDMLLDEADATVRRTYLPAYRMGIGNYDDPVSAIWAVIGWGVSMPYRFSAPLAYAHALTGDSKYLDALALNYDFLFGVNPMGKTFVAGMGWNPPKRPEIAIWFYQTPAGEYIWHSPSMALPVSSGITVYGLGDEVPYYPTAKDPGGPWPLMHCHRDVDRGQEPYSEFTIGQTLGPTALMTLYLASQDQALCAKK